MSIDLATTVIFIFTAITLVTTYNVYKIKSNRLYKYIPSLVVALGILFFIIKSIFISKGFGVIIDIYAIILLAFVFFITLIFAITLDIIYLRKRKNK